MAASPAKQKLHVAMKHGLMSFIEAAKPHRRPKLHLVAQTPAPLHRREERSIDPVALTVLAVNRLGLATLRSATNGRVSTVAVPDQRTAEIFRAALRQMEKARCTDRLINIVVADDSARGSGGGHVGEA